MVGKTAKDKKKGAKDKQASPLKRSFKNGQAATSKASSTSAAATSNKRPAPADEPTRAQHSGFLSYLRFATKDSKDIDLHNQAAIIQREYSKMSSSQKKDVIVEFFKQGGKRPGLTILYKQMVQMIQSSLDGEWQGYATISMVMDLHKVPISKTRFPNTSPTRY